MYSIIKRIFDVVLAVTALLLLSPVVAVTALLVLCFLGRPVLFRQARPGLGERLFGCLKFRTMTNACDPAGQLLPDGERMTPLGRWLRRASLDELPQLWNVLKGEMSLVGPRPLLVHYLPRYSAEQRRRHLVRPGITGWAQIHGRNMTDWPTRLALDIWYVDHCSLMVDLRILWRTVWKVLAARDISPPGRVSMNEFMGTSVTD